MIELEHSPLGGSSAKRFMSCAFSFLKQREEIRAGTFSDVPSEFAALGTAAHELGAKCLIENREPFEYLGQRFGDYRVGYPEEIDPNAVAVYVNECRSILDQVKGRPYLPIIETTFSLPHIHPLFKGTVDFGVLNQQGLWLRDYKNGEGVGVETVGNFQLLYYAALLILSMSDTNPMPHDLPVNLGIVQPNFYGLYEEVVPWIVTVGYVLDWVDNELLPRMNFLYGSERGPTEEDAVAGEHCQFCPVLTLCPKMQSAFRMYATGEEDFVTMLTDEQVNDFYSQREHARRFMTALERVAFARLSTGGKIPSAKLVEKQRARVWGPGAAKVIEETFGDDAFEPRKLKSPAGIEKLSSRGKEMALEHGYKPEADALTIAPISDRRPEAKPRTNANVFEAHAVAQTNEF